ncbi:hypothetical protein JD844_034316 [Phrynosoma platyrhinos]|uniref:tRNA-dihydrouridine(47) synthase [NAD(P)(+)] n=1 Tax=Phrynosoma platyrhinos TaxID=52577 RepID=A0ABQ7T926_PHRPL|nr:hypothetical protein JD844_034316 [Phrynosoma platyrhinos]
MEPGEVPAELQNSGGDSEKESLPKMSTEPEAWFEENLNKKPKEDTLCSRKKTDNECLFGPLRGFPDDIKKYMATKPPDLGDSCIHFSQFGKCQYWVTCRFAGAHLGEGYQNVVNEELWKKWEGKSAVRNMLMIPDSRDKILRDFPFTKSSDYLSCLEKVKNKAAPPVKKKVPPDSTLKRIGVLTDEDLIRLRPCEKRKLDLQGKLYLSPIAKCGSLPFRRICKRFGADITCGEMLCCVLSKNQIPGVTPCLHRHETEDLFGIQLQGMAPTPMIRYGELLNETSQVDFVDINAEYLESATLMKRSIHFEQIVRGMDYVLDVPLTVKLRTVLFPVYRAALIKPWIFTEIKERRHWDISARERLDILKDLTNYGLEYWGSDMIGVEKTRYSLLNWLSFLCRYIPVGLLEHLPPKMTDQHPGVLYGDYLENLMSSQMIKDWVKISEMFLGTVPDYYRFTPAHKIDKYFIQT